MTGKKNRFIQDRNKGRPGEAFVLKHLGRLVQDTVIDVADTTDEKISGKDCVATVLSPCSNTEEKKNVEIKTVWNFLTRTNDGEEPSGTLAFELWKNDKRETLGWLDEMVHPERHSRAVQPDILIFLFVAYENVFASVAFENTDALIERLRDLGFKLGIDLDNIPCGGNALEWQPPDITIAENLWRLPFSLLEDLATVTIIGEKPRERPDIVSGPDGTRTCPSQIQKQRYDRLLLASGSRPRIDTDEEFVRAFVGDETDHIFAVIDHDLNVLENPDFDKQFSCLAKFDNQKGRVLDSVKWLLRSMLAHENPSREVNGKRYFPVSYEWLWRWCAGYGKNRALETWHRNLKLALMFELLDYYRPPKDSTNPIDQMVNAKNGEYKSVGYYAPILWTRDVLLKADYGAQTYILDNVKTSQISKDTLLREEENFKKVDKGFGYDGRRVAKAKEYVEELFKQTIFDMVYEKGYALPADIYRKVELTMKKEKRLWTVKPDRLLTEEGKREEARQQPYWKEFGRLKKNMKQLAESLYFVYKQLSKEDKEWLDGTENIPTGTRIIRVKKFPDGYIANVNKYRLEKRKKANEARRKKYAEKKEQAKSTDNQ